MSYGSPRYAKRLPLSGSSIQTQAVSVEILIPGAVTPVYGPITDNTSAGVTGGAGVTIEAVSGTVVGPSQTITVVIPGQVAVVDNPAPPPDIGAPAPPPTIAPPVVVPPVFPPTPPIPPAPGEPPMPPAPPPASLPTIVGRNPYFAQALILGQTAGRVIMATSVRYFSPGVVPDKWTAGSITQLTVYETADGINFSRVGTNSTPIYPQYLQVCNGICPNNSYVCIDTHHSKVFRGANGVMPVEITGQLEGERPMFLGSNSSFFLIMTAEGHSYSSPDGVAWTKRGTHGLGIISYTAVDGPYDIYDIIPQPITYANGYWATELMGNVSNTTYATGAWTVIFPSPAVAHPDYPSSPVYPARGALYYNGSVYLSKGAYIQQDGPRRYVSGILTSTDLVTWQWRYATLSTAGFNVKVIGTEFIVVNESGEKWFTTNNGTVWNVGIELSRPLQQCLPIINGVTLWVSFSRGLSDIIPTTTPDKVVLYSTTGQPAAVVSLPVAAITP